VGRCWPRHGEVHRRRPGCISHGARRRDGRRKRAGPRTVAQRGARSTTALVSDAPEHPDAANADPPPAKRARAPVPTGRTSCERLWACAAWAARTCEVRALHQPSSTTRYVRPAKHVLAETRRRACFVRRSHARLPCDLGPDGPAGYSRYTQLDPVLPAAPGRSMAAGVPKTFRAVTGAATPVAVTNVLNFGSPEGIRRFIVAVQAKGRSGGASPTAWLRPL